MARKLVMDQELNAIAEDERAEEAAQRGEELCNGELAGARRDFARLDLGEVEQVVHHLRQVLRGLLDELHLLFLLGRDEDPLGPRRAGGSSGGAGR